MFSSVPAEELVHLFSKEENAPPPHFPESSAAKESPLSEETSAPSGMQWPGSALPSAEVKAESPAGFPPSPEFPEASSAKESPLPKETSTPSGMQWPGTALPSAEVTAESSTGFPPSPGFPESSATKESTLPKETSTLSGMQWPGTALSSAEETDDDEIVVLWNAAEAAEAAGAAGEPQTDVVRPEVWSRPEFQRLRLQMERAWPGTSIADAFVNFAGKGSDTLYVGIFALVANDLGLTTEESTAIFHILSGDKSYVQLEDWDGFLLGALRIAPQASNAAQPPARANVPEADLADLDSDTMGTRTPGTTSDLEDPSTEEASYQSPTRQRNDLRELVEELQAQLKLSQEEANRQEEAATELRQKIRLTQVWGTIGSVQELIKPAGFGFIRPYSGQVDGKDLFFHKSELKKGNFRALAMGDEVSYEVKWNPAKKKTFAENVMLTRRHS